MKTNKGKLLVLALSATAFLSLAGSITGTVAWYQYSTRATAGIMGSSKSVTENLQISTDGVNWGSDLKSSDILAAARTKANNQEAASAITPITSGNMDKDGTLMLYDAPQYQYGGSYDNWHTANIKNYLQFDLYFRFIKKVDGKTNYIQRDVKLTDLSITSLGTAEDAGTDVLAKAMRIHFSSKSATNAGINSLASKEGETTATVGNLDLNNDGNLDTPNKYEWEKENQKIDYGTGSQTAYSAEDKTGNALLAATDNKGDLTGGKTIATTLTKGQLGKTETDTSKVTVTIWFEGWQKLTNNGSETAMWTDDLIKDTTFRIGMQFGCDRDTDYTNPVVDEKKSDEQNSAANQ